MKQSGIAAFFGGKAAPSRPTDKPSSAALAAAGKPSITSPQGGSDAAEKKPRKRLKRVIESDGDDDVAVDVTKGLDESDVALRPSKKLSAGAAVAALASPSDDGHASASPAVQSKQRSQAETAADEAHGADAAVPASPADKKEAVSAFGKMMGASRAIGAAKKNGAKAAAAESDDEVGEDAAGSGAAPGVAKKRQAAAKGATKTDGVGAGALEAAAKHASVDINGIITWKAGQPVPYSFLANTFEAIAETSKRLSIIHTLATAFRAILATTPADLLPAVYLCTNRVAPPHTGIELGVGDAILFKALAQATGRAEALIKKEYGECGDLGVVAVNARSTQRTMFQPAPLTIASVFKTFKDIASASGGASQEKKKGLIVKLLVSCKENEAGYVMRSLQSKLRIGLAEQSVLVALGQAVVLQQEGGSAKDLADTLERAAAVVKKAYSECPSYDLMIPALLNHSIWSLPDHCHFTPGVPVKPMLAKATNGVSEVLDKFQDTEFTCEYKYDGERAQIHVLEDGTVSIYSRNAENNTGKYPDIVGRVKGWLQPGVKSIVLDTEAVAWDPEHKKIKPFQILSTRARKDVKVGDIKVDVCVFAFDCLYLNGEPLLTKPLTERREALYGSLKEVEGQLAFATAKVSRDVEELEAFLNESVEIGTEGLIVKTMHDTYEPSKRSTHWLKLKKDYLEGCGDTFDVVPIGAFFGRGKRTGVFGAYLLAVYDDEGECYQAISKLGTGFSEEQLQQLAESLRPHIIQQPRSYFAWGEGLAPDVWFDPVQVWEVKAADLSISPVYKAAVGLVDPAKGISIRFPRLLRVREDKNPEDATTASQVADMYRRQAVVKQQRPAEEGDEEDM